MEINNKKVVNAWCSYDIANSAYNLIITTVLFPIYYQEVTKSAFKGEIINFCGFALKNTVIYDYTIAFAYFIIIILAPLLSGIADYGGYRKRFMQFFTIIGSISCFLLYWFRGENIGFGLSLVALAVIGYAGSLVYYNSFLPMIASKEHHDKISAKGFSWGYGGSMVLLIINLLTIENYQFFKFSGKLEALKFSFLEVGIWWLVISQFAFYFLKDYPPKGKLKMTILKNGYNELNNVLSSIKKQKNTKLFLISFLFFSMGVQTVILVASIFGSAELGITGSKLIVTIILLQVLGIVGSYLFSRVSIKFGNKVSLIIMLLIWVAICISAYFTKNEYQFYGVAAAVGMVIGGIQSQSRSTYSKLIPKETIDTASYFSFYDITEKIAVVLGMFSFGFIDQLTGSMRNSAISMSFFFFIALIILLFTKLPMPFANIEKN